MGNITVEQITTSIAIITGIIGSVILLWQYTQKLIQKALTSNFEELKSKLEDVDNAVKTTDLNATKNFIIARLEELKAGKKLDDITLERFWEQIGHYQSLGGNSYISREIDKLKKDNIL